MNGAGSTKVRPDDPVLLALVEGLAEIGIDACPGTKGIEMLPTQKTPPKTALSDQTILVHGRPKLGKSSMCAQAPGALFIATEAGLNSLEVYQVPVTTWDEFLKACAEVAAGGHQFKTIIIDTLDNAYRMCSEHVCEKNKIEHESDLAYGKGFSLVNNEFYRVLNKLSLLPYGLFLICHSQEKEVETRSGKRTRIVPTLPEKARRMILGMVDIILYCDVETVLGTDGGSRERRVMRTKPTEAYEAGDRTGRLPEVIDLNYAKLVDAFERGMPAAELAGPPSPQFPSQAASESASAPPEKPLATETQVNDFEDLVAALEIPNETIAGRLAQFSVNDPRALGKDDMDAILAKLRAAASEKANAKQKEETA